MTLIQADAGLGDMSKRTDALKLVRQIRKALGLNGESQQDLLRRARDRLGLTNQELAAALEVSDATLLAWLAPKGAGKHRSMPEAAKLVLAAILAKRKP